MHATFLSVTHYFISTFFPLYSTQAANPKMTASAATDWLSTCDAAPVYAGVGPTTPVPEATPDGTTVALAVVDTKVEGANKTQSVTDPSKSDGAEPRKRGELTRDDNNDTARAGLRSRARRSNAHARRGGRAGLGAQQAANIAAASGAQSGGGGEQRHAGGVCGVGRDAADGVCGRGKDGRCGVAGGDDGRDGRCVGGGPGGEDDGGGDALGDGEGDGLRCREGREDEESCCVLHFCGWIGG